MPAYDDLPEENNYKALAAGKSYLNYSNFNSRLNISALNLNDKDINDTIFQENLLVVRPTTRGFQFTSTHASELISEAKAETDSDFFASLNAKKISGRSIYAFDLRINQRVPLNQEDMFEIYVNLCSNHKTSPPLFVVTGWSSKGKQFDTIEDSQTIQRELELFRNLKIRNPNSTRPWQFVLEPIGAYLYLGSLLLRNKNKINNESFNIGPKKNLDKKVSELIKLAKKSLKNLKYSVSKDNSKKEAKLLKLNCSKVFKLTGWKPIYNFNETVKNTIAWYINFYLKKKDNLEYSVKEIEKYVNAAKRKKVKWIN